jgi:hypothetical protein
MSPSSIIADSVLAIDVGSVYTRAVLFEVSNLPLPGEDGFNIVVLITTSAGLARPRGAAGFRADFLNAETPYPACQADGRVSTNVLLRCRLDHLRVAVDR